MNYNNLCICFQPAIKIDAFCFQFLILDWRNCWQGCWTEKEYLAEELNYLSALENESVERPQPTPSRNGQPSGRSKSSHASPNIAQPRKSTSTRSNSGDQSKSTGRAPSSDRNGRATPPNLPPRDADIPSQSAPRQRGGHAEYDSLDQRAFSTSDGLNIRGAPSRPPPSISTQNSVDHDGDDGATPTQALHSRGPSDTQFRLDLSNPPSSPFNIKF